jgi:hypothetical protein
MATTPPAWKQYQCQISLFTAHPGMDGENLPLYTSCWVLFHHRCPLEAQHDDHCTPGFLGLGLIHSPSTHLSYASTRPRPIAGQQKSKACTSARHRTWGLFTVPSITSPWHPKDGWPFLEHVATTISTAPVEPSLLRHRPSAFT